MRRNPGTRRRITVEIGFPSTGQFHFATTTIRAAWLIERIPALFEYGNRGWPRTRFCYIQRWTFLYTGVTPIRGASGH